MFTKLIAQLRLIPVRFRGNILYRNRAITRAVEQFRTTGKRHRVFFIAGEYRVWTRQDLQHMKHDRKIKHSINSTAMDYIALFDTELMNYPKDYFKIYNPFKRHLNPKVETRYQRV